MANNAPNDLQLLLNFIDADLQLEDDELAVQLLLQDMQHRPGRGHMAHERHPRANFNFVPPEVTEAIVNNIIDNHPTKLNDYIGFYPEEFHHLAALFVPALRAAGGIRGQRFRRCKFSERTRLFFLLQFLKINDTARHQEMEHQWSKSSCNRSLIHCANILRDVLRDNIGNIFPDAEEREFLRNIAPEPLREEGVFLFIDGTKYQSRNSINPDASRRDYSAYNDIGINAQIGSDIFGRVRYYEIGFDGRSHDANTYLQTAAFLQMNGIEWGDNETVCTDCAYAGRSNININARPICKPLTIAQINALPANERPAARLRSRIIRTARLGNEDVLEYGKRGAYAADRCKSRISLSMHRIMQVTFVELAILLGIKVQQMRGQVCQSNPSVVGAGEEGINFSLRIINYYVPGRLFTCPEYERAFYGANTTGEGTVIPHPIID